MKTTQMKMTTMFVMFVMTTTKMKKEEGGGRREKEAKEEELEEEKEQEEEHVKSTLEAWIYFDGRLRSNVGASGARHSSSVCRMSPRGQHPG